jgi:hypothetical protein
VLTTAQVERITLISGISLPPAVKFYPGFDPKLSALSRRKRNQKEQIPVFCRQDKKEKDTIMDFLSRIADWFVATNLHDQILNVEVVPLFTNPYFIIPFSILILYMLYKQNWRDLIILAICIAVWWASGTPYMNSLIVNGEIQIGKVLPVIFGGAAVVGFLIYLLFGRSD